MKRSFLLLTFITLLSAIPTMAQFDVGFDFRNTSAYVADPSCCTYEINLNVSNDYPTTRTVNGNSVTFGWESAAPSASSANRSTSVDHRIAGISYGLNNATTSTFRVDLPAAGSYKISWVIGDGVGGNPQTNYIKLNDTTTTLVSYLPKSTTAAQMADINGATCTTPWTACINATKTVTFSTTILRIVLAGTVDSNVSAIAHLRITANTSAVVRHRASVIQQ